MDNTIGKDSNTNVFLYPFTVITDKTRFSSISSMMNIDNIWKTKPNIVFELSKNNINARKSTTVALNLPASLHTFRTDDLIKNTSY